AQEHRVPAAQRDEIAHGAEDAVRVARLTSLEPAVLLDHMAGRNNPEAGDPELQPETEDPLDLLPQRRVRMVEGGLEVVEAMVIVGARLLVPRPDLRFLPGEDRLLALGERGRSIR